MRAGAGSRPSVRWLAAGFTLVLVAVARAAAGMTTTTRVGPTRRREHRDQDEQRRPSGDVTALEVDRTSRFAKARHVLRAGDRASPRRRRRRPTTASPRTRSRSRTSASRSKTSRRSASRSRSATPPTRSSGSSASSTTAAAASTAASSISASSRRRRSRRRVRTRTRSRRPRASPRPRTTRPCSRSRAAAGAARAARRASPTRTTPIYLTTYNITQDEIEDAGNRLYSLALSSADGLEYLARTLDDAGCVRRQDRRHRHAGLAGRPRHRRRTVSRHAEGPRAST